MFCVKGIVEDFEVGLYKVVLHSQCMVVDVCELTKLWLALKLDINSINSTKNL